MAKLSVIHEPKIRSGGKNAGIEAWGGIALAGRSSRETHRPTGNWAKEIERRELVLKMTLNTEINEIRGTS